MIWVEMITIKTYSSLASSEVIRKYHSMTTTGHKEIPKEIAMLRNNTDPNCFCIRITWLGEIPDRGKSAIGLGMAEAFSKGGRSYHSVWVCETCNVFSV